MTSEFYKDLEIFITGGSGVVGKAAVEKLLRSCNVKKIYVLLRSRKGLTAEDRLNEIKKNAIFNVLKQSKPNELDKLIAIPGDVGLDGLGISSQDRETIKNVAIFIHSAATTRFNEPVRKAIAVNLKSTLEALKIAETLPNFKIFIHVSTFFSNPYLNFVEDKVYPAKFDWKIALKTIESRYDQTGPAFDAITEKLIGEFPNTYLFTKHLSEQCVNDYRHKVPVAIYRPSIVIGAIEEPEPGFAESRIGMMGLMSVFAAGIMKVIYASRSLKLDLTPLDCCTKGLLIFTSRSAKKLEKFKNETKVGMFSSWGIYDNTFGNITAHSKQTTSEFPGEKAVLIPGFTATLCPFIFYFKHIFLHLLPAAMIDLLLRICGKRPFMMYIQRKIWITSGVLGFFLKQTYQSTGPTDFQDIIKDEKGTEFDMGTLSDCLTQDGAHEKMRIALRGCRKFLLKEDESTLPRAKKILKAKIIAYNIMRTYFLYILGCAIYRRTMEYFSQ